MAQANTERVLADLYELRQIGEYKSGVHRPTLSSEDMASREWLCAKLREIGHEAQIDGIANVFGRAPGDGRVALAGSHIESQNHAGWLDGALGVVYALEAARAVAECPNLSTASAGVDVIAFADEEGHFGGFFGSSSAVGELDEATIDAAQDRSGRGALRDLLAQAGLAGRSRLQIDPARYAGFYEAHIEQGATLEGEGNRIGVVTSIVAIWQYRIVFKGEQNHAGTTSMTRRRDAGRTMMELWRRIEDSFPSVAGEHSVWTVGRTVLEPGDPSIIPGRAEMLFQLRDADPIVLDAMQAKLREIVAEIDSEGQCSAHLEIISQTRPAVMDQTVRGTLVEAATAIAPDHWRMMPSGAGHDAQLIQPHVPSAMLFVPSIGGISHHWSENTLDEDIKLGAAIYVDAISRLLSR